MPFIPHTEEDVRRMLAAIGVTQIEDLFDEVPAHLRIQDLPDMPAGLSEMQIAQRMHARGQQDSRPLCFMGAGAYDHHIPAAVWEITTRGEYYSAYTPYQAEASQGTLQLLYEYQSMMTALMAMDVSNASLYDGASALAEAILMAVRAHRKSKSKRILLPDSLHPAYRKVAQNIVGHQGIRLESIPFDTQTGVTKLDALKAYAGEDIAAIVIPQPNFFGMLEPVEELTAWAVENKALSIAVVNPVAMSVLSPPGDWHDSGVDIACGEGQPLGAPVSSGGPYFGFICCRQKHVRQMPGRIIGKTEDTQGREGFTLTLQAREQHIRRSKATSNICTNQGLLVTAATIHMALLGAEGLARVAAASHANTRHLVNELSRIEGIEPLFKGAFFHECALRCALPVKDIMRSLAAHNLLGGYDLADEFAHLGAAFTVCATEKRSDEEMQQYIEKMTRVMGLRHQTKCPVQPRFD
ncbi:MAG: aminomethyl-transferring glycine dehydrogenase subunit GcvPA [gamma proteobacterium symbiont of Bathyaustriella thionipta]|nr:aminomethyl-transferring glycine dehydrogenase subunit GcvPA [gamma proteobacterium symbiont of Bathyaustriella thionipta]